MYSKSYKMKKLFHFYKNKTRSEQMTKCPFGKAIEDDSPEWSISKAPCSELCGAFVELGNVQCGCPCVTLGHAGAMHQLEYLLRKEGYFDSTGREI
jgi:hypothetical protein